MKDEKPAPEVSSNGQADTSAGPSAPPKEEDGKAGFEYEENVKEFTGLIFHCPKCDAAFHLHVAHVELNPLPRTIVKAGVRR